MSLFRIAAVLAGLAALAALGAGAAADFGAAVRAWLMGFVFASLAPAGALVMILVGSLTRAPWRTDFFAEFGAVAGSAPWLWLLGLPIALLLPLAYPWARPGGAPHHLALFLSPAAFLARAAVTLAGWSLLAFLVLRGRLSDLAAALGLIFQGLVLSFIPNDWALSTQPGWTTTDIGMTFLALEVAVASALVLVFGPGRPQQGRDDLAGFLIAGVLGLIYMTFVAFLIDWYGDLPDRVDWWRDRIIDGRWMAIDAALAAGVLTLAVLALRRYRTAGAVALVGVAVWCAWLFAPDLGRFAWLVAPAALVFHAAVLGLAASLIVGARLGRGEASHA